MPTLAALAGLPPPPAAWALPGADLSPALAGAALAKDAAFSQMTRCRNCSLAYAAEASQCAFDAAADAGFAVPCALAPREHFDLMGFSVRTADWRFTTWCAWNGAHLAANFSACEDELLFDHRGQAGEPPLFRPDAESENVAGDAQLAPVVDSLRARIRAQFGAQ
jgi:hypothetical protein